MTTNTTVTVKPVSGRRFMKGVSAIKDANGVFDPSSKTWAVPAGNWHMLHIDRDVVAISETPVHKGMGVWVMESTGEEF